jgi:hypothetical protein
LLPDALICRIPLIYALLDFYPYRKYNAAVANRQAEYVSYSLCLGSVPNFHTGPSRSISAVEGGGPPVAQSSPSRCQPVSLVTPRFSSALPERYCFATHCLTYVFVKIDCIIFHAVASALVTPPLAPCTFILTRPLIRFVSTRHARTGSLSQTLSVTRMRC